MVTRSCQRKAWERGAIERVKGEERGICAASLSSWQISSHQKPKASRSTYTFRCRSKHSKGSPVERDMWIAAIREAMENARSRKGPSLSHLLSLSTTSSSLSPSLSCFQISSFRALLTRPDGLLTSHRCVEQDSSERRNSERGNSSPLSEEEDAHRSKRREVDSMKVERRR